MAEPADLLAYAVKLLASASGDVEYRNVIERAYYSAFHAARQFEEALPIRSQAVHAGSHESLFQRLERPDRQLEYGLQVISKDIAAQLRILKPLRERATYELAETITIAHAEQAVRAATDIVDECRKGGRKIRSK